MPKLKNYALYLVVSVIAANLAYAAVTPIEFTDFTYSATRSSGADSDNSHTSTATETVCLPDAVASASECTALKGSLAEAVACTENGTTKYNCICKSGSNTCADKCEADCYTSCDGLLTVTDGRSCSAATLRYSLIDETVNICRQNGSAGTTGQYCNYISCGSIAPKLVSQNKDGSGDTAFLDLCNDLGGSTNAQSECINEAGDRHFRVCLLPPCDGKSTQPADLNNLSNNRCIDGSSPEYCSNDGSSVNFYCPNIEACPSFSGIGDDFFHDADLTDPSKNTACSGNNYSLENANLNYCLLDGAPKYYCNYKTCATVTASGDTILMSDESVSELTCAVDSLFDDPQAGYCLKTAGTSGTPAAYEAVCQSACPMDLASAGLLGTDKDMCTAEKQGISLDPAKNYTARCIKDGALNFHCNYQACDRITQLAQKDDAAGTLCAANYNGAYIGACSYVEGNVTKYTKPCLCGSEFKNNSGGCGDYKQNEVCLAENAQVDAQGQLIDYDGNKNGKIPAYKGSSAAYLEQELVTPVKVKYSANCIYPMCQDNEMITTASGGISPTSSPKDLTYLTEVNTCVIPAGYDGFRPKIADTRTVYACDPDVYTQSVTTCSEGELPFSLSLGLAATPYCNWNAQTKINNDGTSAAIADEKILMTHCIERCPTDDQMELIAAGYTHVVQFNENQCSLVGQNDKLAHYCIAQTGLSGGHALENSGDSWQLKEYDLYYTCDCPEGYISEFDCKNKFTDKEGIPGGHTCTGKDGTKRYQFCFPKCEGQQDPEDDTAQSPAYVSDRSSCYLEQNGSSSQSSGMTEIPQTSISTLNGCQRFFDDETASSNAKKGILVDSGRNPVKQSLMNAYCLLDDGSMHDYRYWMTEVRYDIWNATELCYTDVLYDDRGNPVDIDSCYPQDKEIYCGGKGQPNCPTERHCQDDRSFTYRQVLDNCINNVFFTAHDTLDSDTGNIPCDVYFIDKIPACMGKGNCVSTGEVDLCDTLRGGDACRIHFYGLVNGSWEDQKIDATSNYDADYEFCKINNATSTYYCTDSSGNKVSDCAEAKTTRCCPFDASGKIDTSGCITDSNHFITNINGTCAQGTPMKQTGYRCAGTNNTVIECNENAVKCCNFKYDSGFWTLTDEDSCSTDYVGLGAKGGSDCMIVDNTSSGNLCFTDQETANASYAYWQCGCPGNYMTQEQCESEKGSEAKLSGSWCKYDGTADDKARADLCVISCNAATDVAVPADTGNCATSYGAVDRGNRCDLNGELQIQCQCRDGWQTVAEYCSANQNSLIGAGKTYASMEECRNKTVGKGTPCKVDAALAGGSANLYRYEAFAVACPEDASLTLADTIDGCENGGTPILCYKKDLTGTGQPKYLCNCDGFSTYAELMEKSGYCVETADGSDKPLCSSLSENNKSQYVGLGPVCTYDNGVRKYKSLVEGCGYTGKVVHPSNYICSIGDEITQTDKCYEYNNTGVNDVRHICSCPSSWHLAGTCGDGMVAVGTACALEGSGIDKIKYESCEKQCRVSSVDQPVVSDSTMCPDVGGRQAGTTECYLSNGSASPSYECNCPADYHSMAEFLELNCQNPDGKDYCQPGVELLGVGEACRYDGEVKYQSYAVKCPSDRPLFYTSADCRANGVPGVNPISCLESDGDSQRKWYCDCPPSFYKAGATEDDVNGAYKACKTTADGLPAEASGYVCNLQPDSNMYQECLPLCTALGSNNGEGELVDDKVTCQNEHGIEAQWNKCSNSHIAFNKCYCPNDWEVCSNEHNSMPNSDKFCTMNGNTYYSQCTQQACTTANYIMAAGLDTEAQRDAACQAKLGSAARASTYACSATGNDGTVQTAYDCLCDTTTYATECKYPYVEPTGTGEDAKFCYQIGSSGKPTSTKLFQQCKVNSEMDICGQPTSDSLDSDGKRIPLTGMTTYVVSTETECKSKYGPGAIARVCETPDYYQRKYNCYFDASKYQFTETNCSIKNSLSGGYVVINGKKHYRECNCHPSYKWHRLNCAGILSGGSCQQKLTGEFAGQDRETPLVGAKTDDFGNSIKVTSHFIYCACTDDFNKTCDGPNEEGEGEFCEVNGVKKYRNCKCNKVEKPEGWADNYWGCPGGVTPTGVTISDGCGGKYWQCVKSPCTWQHTEQCNGNHQVGVDPCMDDTGKVVAYKSCQCEPEYSNLCSGDKVGEGEPCLLKGQYYYKNCVFKGTCVKGENLTCRGDLQIGVNPCTSQVTGETLFEKCVCASGYDKVCADGEVGVGQACVLNGVNYYSQCQKPAASCTQEHVAACNVNQTSYDPCVGSDNKIYYKCHCPASWTDCGGADNMAEGAESCTENGKTVYSQCKTGSECSYDQELYYKECNKSQVGSGGSCLSSEGVIKYAVCEDNSECRSKGYQFSCNGINQDGINNDVCIDDKGNKLYRQCKCPANYISCPGANNTKGTPCTPTLENGSMGPTVYSSCTCDETQYRYTCEKSGDNQGVIPGNTTSCTPYTYNASTGAAEAGTTLYSACDCSDEYRYNCAANGLKKEGKYCLVAEGAEKLYASCACDEEIYNNTCKDESNPGLQAPADASKKCVALNADGTTATPLYSECACGTYYRFKCGGNGWEGNNTGEDGTGSVTDFCKDPQSGEVWYRACRCNSDFSQTCESSGANKLQKPSIASGEESTLICLESTYVGGKEVLTNKYKSCICSGGSGSTAPGIYGPYKYLCDGTDEGVGGGAGYSDKYNTSENDYCQLSGEAKRYKQCICNKNQFTCKKKGDNEYVEINPDGSEITRTDPDPLEPAEGTDSCVEITASGTHIEYYASCSCIPNEESCKGYNYPVNHEIGSSEFSKDVEANCGNAENYLICPDSNCGKKMYKCGVEDLRYKYTEKSCDLDDVINNGAHDKRWEVKGAQKSFTRCRSTGFPGDQCPSGQTVTVNLWTDCDCTSSLYSDQDCIDLSQWWANHYFTYPGGITVELVCKSKASGNPSECGGSRGTLIRAEDRYGKCITRSGQTVYGGCRCIYNWQSNSCGSHALHCYEKLNGGDEIAQGTVCF